MTTANKAKTKEEKPVRVMCKVTIVTPGLSDAVIKIFPAEHTSEKVWLDHGPGIERWKVIKRLMQQFAPRNEAIPDPIKYHPSIKNLVSTDVTEDKIPVVKLQGGAFLKKPIDDRPVYAKNTDAQKKDVELADLKDQVKKLTDAVISMKGDGK